MKGLIQKELARLEKVKAFTPNVHAQWMKEENERDFIRWCREEQPKQKISYAGLPSRLYEPVKEESFMRRFISQFLP